MNNPKQATISRFTNLLDGSIINSASVSTIIEYYEAQLRNAPIVVKTNCSITNNFLDDQYNEENEDCY